MLILKGFLLTSPHNWISYRFFFSSERYMYIEQRPTFMRDGNLLVTLPVNVANEVLKKSPMVWYFELFHYYIIAILSFLFNCTLNIDHFIFVSCFSIISPNSIMPLFVRIDIDALMHICVFQCCQVGWTDENWFMSIVLTLWFSKDVTVAHRRVKVSAINAIFNDLLVNEEVNFTLEFQVCFSCLLDDLLAWRPEIKVIKRISSFSPNEPA